MTDRPTVLVLGGDGIIGRGLQRALDDLHYDVTFATRSGTLAHRGDEAALVLDAQKADDVRRVVNNAEYDVVIDLVSFTSKDVHSMLAALDGMITQYIFISSATLCAGSGEAAITEDDLPTTYTWGYPASKLEAEATVGEYASMNYTIVRPYIIYSEDRLAFGVWEVDHVLNRLSRDADIFVGDEILGSTTAVTHTTDLGRAIGLLIANEQAYGATVNFASEEAVTWRDLFDVARKAMRSSSRIIGGTGIGLLESNFPELKGKFADRAAFRQFDISRFRQICGEFEFEHSPRSDYAELTSSMFPKSAPPNCTETGRMDRLVLAAGGRSLGRPRLPSGPPGKSRAGRVLRYASGRSPLLRSLLLRTVLRAGPGHPGADAYS